MACFTIRLFAVAVVILAIRAADVLGQVNDAGAAQAGAADVGNGMVLRSYDVTGLVNHVDQAEGFCDVIRYTVHPGSWAENEFNLFDGEGRIGFDRAGRLEVFNTVEVQAAVEQLLADLRTRAQMPRVQRGPATKRAAVPAPINRSKPIRTGKQDDDGTPLVIVTYFLSDIVDFSNENDVAKAIDAIQNNIDLSSWNTVGGTGVIQPQYNCGALVILQTEEHHREIESYLDQIRTKFLNKRR